MKPNGKWTITVVMLLAVLGLLSGCDTVGGQGDMAEPLDSSIYANPDVTDESPRLRLLLTDAPISNITNVWLTVSQVSAIPKNGGSTVVLSNETQTLDLLNLRYGVTRTLGISTLPPGEYSQLRLLVTDSTLVVNGVTHDLFIPSGATSGVKINFHFTAASSELATMLIDWDAAASIHFAPGEGYIMRPVIHVRTYRTEPLDTTPPSAPTIASPTHPNQNIWSLANLARFDFEAMDNIGMDGYSYVLDQIPSTLPNEVVNHGPGQEAQPCQPSDYPGEPTCTEIEPYMAIENGLVSIYGTNFGRWTGLVSVMVGDQAADIISISPSQITFQVPDGLGPKTVRVITPRGEAICARNLNVVSDTSFCPDGEFEPGKGLLGKVYEICQNNRNNTCVLPNFDTLGEPHSTLIACELDVPNTYFSEGFPGLDSTLVEWFGIRWTGKIVAPTAGLYKFKIASDDGSKLYINGNLVIDNDGVHAIRSRTGNIQLTAGEHDIAVEYFQGPRWYIALQLLWTPPGGVEVIIPKSSFVLPRNPNADVEAEAPCFCSGHGDGAYNYQLFGLADGDGQVVKLDLYADTPNPTVIGVMKTGSNRTLADVESLSVVGGRFFAVNNTGHSTITNRLYEVFPYQTADGVTPVSEIGQIKHSGSVIQGMHCLATSPDGELFGISKATRKLYQIDPDSAVLTEVMTVPANIEGCAFGPSGLLYAVDNSTVRSKLLRIDTASAQVDDLVELPWTVHVQALTGHPDGHIYASIDNSTNSFPAVAKIRPTDGVVVDYLDPSVKLARIKGLDFDFASERTSCVCDMDLDGESSLSAIGSFLIQDADNDGFSEQITFSGDQVLSQLTPDGDALSSYLGIDFSCFKPRSRVQISALELDKNSVTANRFSFVNKIVAGGFSLELLNPQTCLYSAVLTADIHTERGFLTSRGNKGDFWLRLVNPQVVNSIASVVLAALEEQDEPAALMFHFQTGDPSMQNNIRRGQNVGGAYAFTLQPGRNIVIGNASDLPACPDPVLNQPILGGTATYSEVPDGVWYFHVRGVDASGNWGPASHYKVMIDSTAPDAPAVRSTTHPAQHLEYENPNPVLIVSAADLSGIRGYSYVLDTEADTIPNDSLSGSSSQINFYNLEPGTYWFHVKAQNGAGLWGATRHFKLTVIEPRTTDRPAPPPGYAGITPIIFQMGSPASHYDRFTDEAQHWVSLDSYLIMQREVTNADYRSCVLSYTPSDERCSSDADCDGAMHYCNSQGFCATGCEFEPSRTASYHRSGNGAHPVTHVNWRDAYAYCISQGLRLPTEAEWEYAARGDDSDRYPWGNTYDSKRANGQEHQLLSTLPVGQFDGTRPGKLDGTVCHDGRCLYDMAGNVEEWVADWYHNYPYAPDQETPVENPLVGTREACITTCAGDSQCISGCDWKITRGGSFVADSQRLRVFYRERRLPAMRIDHIGFRCAGDWEAVDEWPVEICDGVDNNLNGLIDEGYPDLDEDGIADCIDEDRDGDGIPNDEDNCPDHPNPDQFDPDMDGFGEVCDPDGELLTVAYHGVTRPWGVAVDSDGTVYVAGSTDGFDLLSTGNNRKGTLMSIGPSRNRTGQVMLADLNDSGSQWRDYRPVDVVLAPNGFLYVADQGSSYDDGIWRVIRNQVTNQLGIDQSPADRNGDPDGTYRYVMGDPETRGIDGASGLAISPEGNSLYVTRGNSKDVRRFYLDLQGNISHSEGPLGEEIASYTQTVLAPAVDSRGWLYYLRTGRLYRQKLVDGVLQAPELISDRKAFQKGVALGFDTSDNLYILSNRGQSNVWPFIGLPVDKMVPAESGFISMVPRDALDAANPSNIIVHADETKQRLIYGGPATREILFDGKRLNAPRGFVVDPYTGNILVANTESDEVVLLDMNRLTAEIIEIAGRYMAAE